MAGRTRERAVEPAVGVENADALPPKGVKHWPLFLVATVLAFLISAAINTSWAGALGYVAVPSLLGLFLVWRATSWKGLAVGYLVLIVLLTMLVGGDVSEKLKGTRAAMKDSCMTGNAQVAMLPSQEQRNSYCSCYSEKMGWPVLREVGVAFLTLKEPEPIQSNKPLMSKASAVVAECASQI